MWGVSRACRLEDDPNNATPGRKVRQIEMRKEDFDLEDGETHLSESTHPNPSLN